MRSREEVEKEAIRYNISLTKEVPKTTSELEKEISKVKESTDLFHRIPNEIFLHIIQGMDVETLINFCKTSKRFAEFCKVDSVWKTLLERDYKYNLKIVYPDDPKKSYLFLKHYNELVNSGKVDIASYDACEWLKIGEIVEYRKDHKPYIIIKIMREDNDDEDSPCSLKLINILESKKPIIVQHKDVTYLYNDQDIAFADAAGGPNEWLQPTRWMKKKESNK